MGVFWALEFGHLLPCAGIVAAPPYPEVAYAYSGAEFNEEFGPAAVASIARGRAEARMTRKRANYQRYRRAYTRQRAIDYWRYFQLHR
jgi:hypothetical protein